MRVYHLFALVHVCTAQAAYQIQKLYQFSDSLQWIENMALRPNGNILLTTFDHAHIYELDPRSHEAPRLAATLPDADVAIGIAQIAPDLFAVAGGYLNRSDYHLHCTARIHLLDFSLPQPRSLLGKLTSPLRLANNNNPPIPYPEAKLPNGMAALPSRPHVLLSADSITGTIYRIDTLTGTIDVALRDPLLIPTSNPDPFLNLIGVNGLKIHHNFLYVTCMSRRFLGRYPIDEHGTPLGPLEILVRYPSARNPDDIAIARNGTVFGAVPLNSVSKVTPGSSNVTYVVDADDDLLRTTSVLLSDDETTLYVSTGGQIEPGGQGGQIFAVHLA